MGVQSPGSEGVWRAGRWGWREVGWEPEGRSAQLGQERPPDAAKAIRAFGRWDGSDSG